jgi:NNP family nitrate/nitrite transporter-like MFS transporter
VSPGGETAASAGDLKPTILQVNLEDCDPGTKDQLTCWYPEDEGFWNKYGAPIAFRSLPISTMNLTLMFASWLMWSILAANIQTAHDKDPSVYAFTDYIDYVDYLNPTQDEMKAYKVLVSSLPAMAGLTGATLRVVNTFLVALCGTRVHNTMNSFIAMIPMLGIGLTLSDPNCSFTSLVILAGASGIGGGAFASSMSSISFFFPKRKQGLALGINAGFGNLGVSLTQLFIPMVCSFAAFGGSAVSEEAGVYPHNSGFLYFIILLILSTAAFFVLRTMPQHGTGNLLQNFVNYCRTEFLGFLGAFTGIGLFLASRSFVKGPALVITRIFVLAIFCCCLTLVLLYFGSQKEVKEKLKKQSEIFKDQHTWWQTYLYIMTFGSFIGYSSAFPKLIKDVFGYLPDGSVNPAMEGAVARYAWMGACIGSLARPIGGWLSDKFSGAAVTHWGTVIEVSSTIGAGVFVRQATGHETPEKFFPGFLVCFLLLFMSTGSSNGSTFRQMSMLFEPEKAGPVLGWTSAVAAYGAAVFPAIFGAADDKGLVLYLFALYYFTCLLVNYYFYYRKNAPRPC